MTNESVASRLSRRSSASVSPVHEILRESDEAEDRYIEAQRVGAWQYEVANGDTRLGYAEWCAHQDEMEEDPRG